MSVRYEAVHWNRQKRIYDTVLLGGLLAYLLLFLGLGALYQPFATLETLLIRGFGSAAFLLLHIVLCIGPLCRIDRRFLPLLYNRRHFGVTTFVCGLAHGSLALFQFHALGDRSPFVSLFVSNTRFGSLSEFPFQLLGAIALSILFVMAATSHDFWLRTLSAPMWKRLHMLVYVVYALLIAHVTLGFLQSERHPGFALLTAAGLAVVVCLHLAAATKERKLDGDRRQADADGFVPVCRLDSIKENRAAVVSVAGERVAVFRYEDKLSAVSNVCQHQNGPLGEGRIIDGCITCPWHGYQYRPADGTSPPPFTEKIPTFDLKLIGETVFVSSRPNPAGMRVEPVPIPQAHKAMA